MPVVAYVTRQHCGSGVAGGHPPAKIAICAGTRLLAGVAPASTNAFWPPVKIVSDLVCSTKFQSMYLINGQWIC
jgi:hypothetical protein